MKFTINTDAKTITIFGSYKAEEFTFIMNQMPPEWKEYSILGPVEEIRYVPEYPPVVPYIPQSPVNPFLPPYIVTCHSKNLI